MPIKKVMNQAQIDEWNARREYRIKHMSYEDACHAVQSGIATRMGLNSRDTEPKHLRVGIDLSKVDQCALARLLIDKGLFTEEEYIEAIRIATIDEVQHLEASLFQHFGTLPTLI